MLRFTTVCRFLWRVSLVGTFFLLCQCATKHQPVGFDPYYSKGPRHLFSLEEMQEATALANKPVLSVFEKKRLVNLYYKEMLSLEKETPRYQQLSESVSALEPDIRNLEQEQTQLKLASFRERGERQGTWVYSEFRDSRTSVYSDVREMWNRDENTQAAQRLDQWLNSRWFRKYASTRARVRTRYLRLRIALDLLDYASVLRNYNRLQRLDRCAWRTRQAAFLTAVLSFVQGKAKQALNILEEKCNVGRSEAAERRDTFWRLRFLEVVDREKAQEGFERFSEAPIPDYYGLQARIRLGKPLRVATESRRSFLWAEFSVPEWVHEDLKKIEEYLRFQLREEALLHLRQVERELRRQPKAFTRPLLYLASLYKAAGKPLRAMRIYASLARHYRAEQPSSEAWLEVNFLAEMYPRPFSQKAEWLTRTWGVDSNFLYALMRQESGFMPTALSPVRAQGLMQMMPFLSKDLSKVWGYGSYYRSDYMLTVEENLKLASFHLYQLKQIAPHPILMAAAYNAGIRRVQKWWRRFGRLPSDIFIELIPIKETRNYVKAVLRNYTYYQLLETGEPASHEIFTRPLPLNMS